MSEKEIHIAVANNKGGAAKTTTVIHLAQAFSQEGKRVIVIDGDKNGTCRSWAVRRGSQEPFPVLSIREAMKYDRAKDIVLYDTEGGITSEEISDLMTVCDYIVIPCKPDMYNMEASEKMAKFFMNHQVNFRVLISDATPHGDFMRARELKNYLTEHGIPCFEQFITRSVKMVDAGDQGKTVSNLSGARFLADRFNEVVLQILRDVAKKKPEKKTNKPITLEFSEDDLDLLEENIERFGENQRNFRMEVAI